MRWLLITLLLLAGCSEVTQTHLFPECNGTGEVRYSCLKQVALGNVSSACEAIDNLRRRDECYYAIRDLDPGNCLSISGSPLRIDCEIEYGLFENMSYCIEQTDERYRHECMRSARKYSADESICGSAKEDEIRDDCYYHVAVSLGDKAICERIIRPNEKDVCYIDMAYSTDDPSICSNAMNESKSEDCNWRMANQIFWNQSIDFCNRFDNEYYRDNCLYIYSLNGKDSTVCPMIGTEHWQNECYEYWNR